MSLFQASDTCNNATRNLDYLVSYRKRLTRLGLVWGDITKIAHFIGDFGALGGTYLRRLLGAKKEWMPENTPEQKRKPR